MRIGTRGSTLARVQADMIGNRLHDILGVVPEIVVIRTQGDRVTDRPLRSLRGQGFFTKEIERALLDRRIDVAVHSFKDLPSMCAAGLEVAAVTAREDPADLLVIAPAVWAPEQRPVPIRAQARVGTSAVRRQAQLAAVRPDIVVQDLRGNVPTRLGKLERGEYDAIFLAAAAARRLDLDFHALRVVRLDPWRFVPAPGQGALAVEMREDDPRFEAVRRALEDAGTREATRIERAIAQRFGGGCSMPLGAYAERQGATWRVAAFWGGLEAGRLAEVTGDDVNGIAGALYRRLASS